MIVVIATVDVVEGKRAEFLEHFQALVPLVEDEEGCLEYGPMVDVETSIDAQIDLRPDVVTVLEKWEDLEALEVHLVAPHMMEYRAKVRDLVRSVSLQVIESAE
ncbi:MAG: putative quinol monooxygenase [Planctomycetota bacterium]|nr:putative quinol monooxygenase [Planctomycetota bacterium]